LELLDEAHHSGGAKLAHERFQSRLADFFGFHGNGFHRRSTSLNQTSGFSTRTRRIPASFFALRSIASSVVSKISQPPVSAQATWSASRNLNPRMQSDSVRAGS